MSSVRLWNIQAQKPMPLSPALISLEKHLEAWIEHDVSLVNPDLLIVGRQVHVDAGILDLLAVDRLGNYWAIIEIKKGNVRRDTIAQAMDYASCLSQLSPVELKDIVDGYLRKKGQILQQMLVENNLDTALFDDANRNLVIYVVGTGRDPHLERLAGFISNRGIPINIVTFDVFEDAAGNQTLLREIEELELETQPVKRIEQPASLPRQSSELTHLMEMAQKNGMGDAFRMIYDAATHYGLFPRLFSRSIMYAPPTDRRRCLIYAPVMRKNGKLMFYTVPEAFAEFYRINMSKVVSLLGEGGYREATVENVQVFIKGLDEIFKMVAADTQDEA